MHSIFSFILSLSSSFPLVWEEEETHNFSPEHHGLMGLEDSSEGSAPSPAVFQKISIQVLKAFCGEDTLACAS